MRGITMTYDKFLLTSSYYSVLDKWYVEIWHQDKGKIGSLPFDALKTFVEQAQLAESEE